VPDATRSADPDELRTQLLRYRASLFDPDTGLPTLPVVLDDVRRMLEVRDDLPVLLVRPEQERDLERVYGWERFDRTLRRVAGFLSEHLGSARRRPGLLCQEAVRGDTFLVFVDDLGHAAELVAAIADGLQPTGDDGDERIALRVGQGVVRRRLAQRLERCIYRGILEARLDFHRRGELLDEARRTEVRTMLERRDVTTLFQPILELPERSVLGFEALSRGPAGSYLEPAEHLFGFTERAGFLGEVEQLCTEEALDAARRLPNGATVFLNLSAAGLDHIESSPRGLAERVRARGIDPSRLVVEITERTYADDPVRLRDMVADLRQVGFRLAIDDMGTGYSSLHAVADLRPDFIKLDQLLVRDLAREPIKRNLVSAILGFARTSDSRVIAEGVESADDVESLEELGVRLQQGFYLGLPRMV
jgi:EAL domain-containing protein (putative c-di-GMP-specific phosphodiesterase class I)